MTNLILRIHLSTFLERFLFAVLLTEVMQCFSSIMYGFIMDLGAVMLFTLSFRTFIFLLILESVTISFVYKKTCNIVFSSSNNEGIPLPHEFSFMFIQYFAGAILLEKSWKKCGAWKNIIRVGRLYRGRGRGDHLLKGSWNLMHAMEPVSLWWCNKEFLTVYPRCR